MSETPPWGTPPPAGPELLGLPEFVMQERAQFFTGNEYDFLSTQGRPLGRISNRTAGWAFGQATWVLTDASGGFVAGIERPFRWGATEFVVRDGAGQEVGKLCQIGGFLQPTGLELYAVDGGVATLTGGGLFGGGVRTLSEPSGRAIGDVSSWSSGLAAFLVGTNNYLIRLDPGLTGPFRLLAVVATAGLDLILNNRRS